MNSNCTTHKNGSKGFEDFSTETISPSKLYFTEDTKVTTPEIKKTGKYRGMIQITKEGIASLLNLPEDVSIREFYVDTNCFQSETIKIMFESDKETEITKSVPEGSCAPLVNLDIEVKEEVKVITRRLRL